jgi:hypothetical protein
MVRQAHHERKAGLCKKSIEAEFSKELNDLADTIEKEKWFGDAEKHSRYRVDFILKDARLIIELDGHAFHSTPEQLENDAIRQRYLTRAGYTVIRFTGREINRDAAACVSEVREIYKERMQRTPSKYRVIYIDYQFYLHQMSKARRFYQEIHPDKVLSLQSLDQFIPNAIKWLHEKSFITAFIFHLPEDTEKLKALNGMVKEYENGEIRINTVADELYMLELGSHMVGFSHLFDEFYLVADDFVYIEPLLSVLHKEVNEQQIDADSYQHLFNGKLLRKCNDESSFSGTDLAYVRWQDVWYPMGITMGLTLYEL